jgi:hypothetical protein
MTEGKCDPGREGTWGYSAGKFFGGVADATRMFSTGMGASVLDPQFDYPTGNTNNWMERPDDSERDARNLARTKVGSEPVEVEPGKWRSQDGRWQYRAKPGDISEKHIHLEQLNPSTGEVIQNVHLRWP